MITKLTNKPLFELNLNFILKIKFIITNFFSKLGFAPPLCANFYRNLYYAMHPIVKMPLSHLFNLIPLG